MNISRYSEAQERDAHAERQRAAGEYAARRLAALRERVEADLERYRSAKEGER